MATDRNSETVVAGQIYLVAGPVRRIDGDTVVIVLDSGQAVRVAAADVCKVDATLGGGGGVTAHGALTGLTVGDDHTQYSLASGARAFTGPVAGVTPVGISDFTTKNYVDSQDLVVFLALDGAKQPLDATLTALAAHVTAANKLTKWTGVDTATTITVASFGETLIATASAAAAISALSLAAVATSASAADLTTGTLLAARMPALTGDITTSAGAVATTLATTGVAAATYQNPTITLDAKGRATAAASGDVVYCDSPMLAVTMSTALETLCTKDVLMAVGDTIEVEVTGTIRNDSAATRTYDFEVKFGIFTMTYTGTATVAFNATNRASFVLRAKCSISSTSVVGGWINTQRATPGAANAALNSATAQYQQLWHTSSTNLVGTQTVVVKAKSSSSTATQQLTVFSWRITKSPQRL
jgi:hypothetical protein